MGLFSVAENRLGKTDEVDPFRALTNVAPAARNEFVLQILDKEVRPLINGLLARALGEGLTQDDRPDLEAEIYLRVVRHLHRVATSRGTTRGAFALSVRAIVLNTLADHRRREQPTRARLANRLRYVFTHDTDLALWERRATLCGLAQWLGRPATAEPEPLPSALVPAAGITREKTSDDPLAAWPHARLHRLVLAIVAGVSGPIRFELLVDHVAGLTGFKEEPELSLMTLGAPDPEEELVSRDHLARTWEEIKLLSARHKQALLLHLRFDSGDSFLRELPALGVADLRGLAQTLEMDLRELLSLWKDLPLDDARIAQLLSLTRQQVINLRQSAKSRLMRRMQQDLEP